MMSTGSEGIPLAITTKVLGPVCVPGRTSNRALTFLDPVATPSALPESSPLFLPFCSRKVDHPKIHASKSYGGGLGAGPGGPQNGAVAVCGEGHP